jgi:hypothetical protein
MSVFHTITGSKFVPAAAAAALALLAAPLASAQWTTVGSIIYYNDGNVGIGISNPGSPLEVRGSDSRTVEVYNTADSGVHYGLRCVTLSDRGIALYGFANSGDGRGYGVYGLTNGRRGYGVYGYSTDDTGGPTYGVYGRAYSSDGAGVFGRGHHGPGVEGQTESTSNGNSTGTGSAAGVRGIVSSSAPGSYSAGVWGINQGSASTGIGVAGYHAGNGYAVYGKVAGGSGYAARFEGGRNYFEGRVGIGESNPAYKLEVDGDIKLGTDDRLFFGDDGENTDSLYFQRKNVSSVRTDLMLYIGDDTGGDDGIDYFRISSNSGQALFYFGSDGNAYKSTGAAWSVFSDRRIKRDIQPVAGSLDRLLQLRGVNFYYTDLSVPGAAPGLQTGFVAQDVERVFPEWVSTVDGVSDIPALKSVTIKGFEALTVEALRQLRAEKDSQIEALRAENDDLRRRLARIESMLSER